MEFRRIPVAQGSLLLEAMMDLVGKVPPVPQPAPKVKKSA
jgi:hypothetical protein